MSLPPRTSRPSDAYQQALNGNRPSAIPRATDPPLQVADTERPPPPVVSTLPPLNSAGYIDGPELQRAFEQLLEGQQALSLGQQETHRQIETMSAQVKELKSMAQEAAQAATVAAERSERAELAANCAKEHAGHEANAWMVAEAAMKALKAQVGDVQTTLSCPQERCVRFLRAQKPDTDE